MNNRSNDRKSVVMFISSMLIFGTIGMIRRSIPVSSAFLAFSRGILGTLFLTAFIKLIGKNNREKLPVPTVLWLAGSGVVMGINWMLLFEAYNYTTVAVATLCYYMQPTIVMLLSPLLFQEKMTAKKTVCAAVAVAGMFLVSGITEGRGAQAGNLRGILLGLGAAVFYSVVVIMNKRISGIDAVRKTTIQLLSAGIAMVPYWLLTGGWSREVFSVKAAGLLLIVGLVHTGIAYVLYFGSMDGLKAHSIALFSYIDPVSALLFSALFLREPLSVCDILGALMILGSAIVSEYRAEPQ